MRLKAPVEREPWKILITQRKTASPGKTFEGDLKIARGSKEG
jgi:hypothetical protein